MQRTAQQSRPGEHYSISLERRRCSNCRDALRGFSGGGFWRGLWLRLGRSHMLTDICRVAGAVCRPNCSIAVYLDLYNHDEAAVWTQVKWS